MKVNLAALFAMFNLASVHACKCKMWNGGGNDWHTTEICCRSAGGDFDESRLDCPAGSPGDSMWIFASCCFSAYACSDCKHGCGQYAAAEAVPGEEPSPTGGPIYPTFTADPQ